MLKSRKFEVLFEKVQTIQKMKNFELLFDYARDIRVLKDILMNENQRLCLNFTKKPNVFEPLREQHIVTGEDEQRVVQYFCTKLREKTMDKYDDYLVEDMSSHIKKKISEELKENQIGILV